ncbi:MAG TPA: histidine phosphatase family protein [Spirochaetia bacterium]|nr:histidine phosphatase family protein [Spirochaetia bacterium]
MKLVLIRHGQTEWNAQRRTQGQRDSPLTETGLRQADHLGQRLRTLSPRAFFCSDTGRARKTADRITLANPGFPPVRPEPRLRELDFGEWEGLAHDEIRTRYPDLYRIYRSDPARFRAPGGEAFPDVQMRFLSFAEELHPESDGTVIAVTHSGTIRVALLALTGRPLSEVWALPSVAETSVSVLSWERGAWRIESAAAVW